MAFVLADTLPTVTPDQAQIVIRKSFSTGTIIDHLQFECIVQKESRDFASRLEKCKSRLRRLDGNFYERYAQHATGLWDVLVNFGSQNKWLFSPADSSDPMHRLMGMNTLLGGRSLTTIFPKDFDIMALILLDIQPGHSFFNINSGCGCMNQIAGMLMGPGCRNHGLEPVREWRTQAEESIKRFSQLDPNISERSTLPRFHEHYPCAFLSGEVLFDRLLIYDCYVRIVDVSGFQFLVAPGGKIVTSYFIDEDDCGFVILQRHHNGQWAEPQKITLGIRGIGIFIVLIMDFPQTLRRLGEDGIRWKEDNLPRFVEERNISSVQRAALDAVGRLMDPLKNVRRNLNNFGSCFLDLRCRSNAHTILSKLNDDIAAFETIDSSTSVSDLAPLHEKVRVLTVTVQQYVFSHGSTDRIYSWFQKRSNSFHLSTAMHLWHLHGMLLFLQVLNNNFQYPFPWINCSLFRSLPIGTTSGRSKMSIFIANYLAEFDQSELKPCPPWRWQISKQKQQQRDLTICVARYVSDVTVMSAIAEAIRSIRRSWDFPMTRRAKETDENINKMIMEIDKFVHHLSNKKIKIFRLVFDVCVHMGNCIEEIHRSIDSLAGFLRSNEQMKEMVTYFHVLFTTMKWNIAGGRMQFEVSTDDYEIDQDVYNAESSFLNNKRLSIESVMDDVCHYLVRRYLSDLKNIVWRAQSCCVELDKFHLVCNERAYYENVLSVPLPKHVVKFLLDRIFVT